MWKAWFNSLELNGKQSKITLKLIYIMIKCNLMLNTQLSSYCNNHKRTFSQLLLLEMLQKMVKVTLEKGIIRQCELRR